MDTMKNMAARDRRLGRPLSFNRDAALEQAMLVFWRHGYETSSIVDLTTAMGITAPSLYTAFGDKKHLFLEAMRRYAKDPTIMEATIAAAPSALDAARDLMRAAACTYTGETTPKGCLLASAAATGSAASAHVQEAVADVRRAVTKSLQDRVSRDVTEGLLPPDTDAAALAGLVMAVNQGMSVLARDGASRPYLLDIVSTFLAVWPSGSNRGHAGRLFC